MKEYKVTVDDEGNINIEPLRRDFKSEIVENGNGILCYVNKEGKPICGYGINSKTLYLYEENFPLSPNAMAASPEICAIFQQALDERLLAIEHDKLVRTRIKDRAYYYISSAGQIFSDIEEDGNVDDARFEFGNYFASKEEAKKCLTEMNELFDEFKYLPGN